MRWGLVHDGCCCADNALADCSGRDRRLHARDPGLRGRLLCEKQLMLHVQLSIADANEGLRRAGDRAPIV